MIVIGTVHNDIQGPERLNRALNHYKPKVITVEYPATVLPDEAYRKALRQRYELRSELERHGLAEPLEKLLFCSVDAVRFEVVVTYEYCRSTAARMEFVDHPGQYVEDVTNESEFLSEYLSGFNPDLSKVGFEVLRRAVVDTTDRMYFSPGHLKRYCDRVECESPEGWRIETRQEVSEAERRETFLADQVNLIKPDLHIGGVAHVFSDYGEFLPVKTLIERLDEKPEKLVRLCEADDARIL